MLNVDRVAVVEQRLRQGAREEDALVDAGAIDEGELLRWLARRYQTRFVATSKLARIDVDRALLELIPRKVAEQYQVFPVLYQPSTQTLSVVAADPSQPNLDRILQQSSHAVEVKLYVARPAAVRAAISKHYAGDLYAFANADTQGKEQYLNLLSLYDKNTVDPDLQGSVFPIDRGSGRPQQGGHAGPNGRSVTPPPGQHNFNERNELSLSVRLPAAITAAPSQATAAARTSLLEMTTVLVSLLENSRGELRGHSAMVARLLRKLAERMRLDDETFHDLSLAALLHDVGKAATYHLTALNVAVFESHRQVAQKVYLTPIKLFDAVPLGPTTISALSNMYERVDGRGFPEALLGKDIPLGARILSVVDTYADLTHNARNPYRRILSPTEACDVLDQHRDAVFDKNLVDLLRQTVTGDDLRARLLSERTTVLLIEPDPEESTVLELRLLEDGFEVMVARTVDEAMAALARGSVEVCIAETELDAMSGFDLLARLRAGSLSASVPWVFLTRDARREAIAKGYELGASDYVLKPASAEVLVAKLRQLLSKRNSRQPRAVAGSLAEIGFPDVVQVLSQGRKTGILSLHSANAQGEVHLLEGAVIHAVWGSSQGDDAFYRMVTLQDGEFSLDASVRPSHRSIHANVEMLLLEGLRRFDEASARG